MTKCLLFLVLNRFLCCSAITILNNDHIYGIKWLLVPDEKCSHKEDIVPRMKGEKVP